MILLPEIKKKPRKPSYKKPEAVKELERMADAEAQKKHRTCPHLAPRTFRDDSANSLTVCITAYIRLKGGFASRLNNPGVYDAKLRKYRPTTSRKGLPDIVSTWNSKSLFIEVKATHDRMSEHQERIRKEQTASGGLYFVANNFTDFKEWFENGII